MADILRMIVVLSALCGLSGFALSYLKMVTAPVIEEQVLTYVQGPAIAGVFTDIDNQPIADRKAFETEKGRVLVFPAMRDGKLVGVALEAKGKGYGGDVGVMVGFNVANDTLAGIGTTTLKETPGLGMRIAEPGFTGQFRGIAAPVGLKSQGGSIDGISGATISSSGAVTAVNLAAEAYKALKPEILKEPAMSSVMQEFTKGLWKDLPPFRLVLGLCPTLAVTNSANNGLGMGAAVIFVLVLSNMIISMVRGIIPKKVRIACFIVIAASLVVAVELLMQAYAYPLYQQLGIFVPLIVVNCIILARAEAFAAKNGVAASVADGLGIGLGFTMSLTFLGSLREILGNGTWFGHPVMWDGFQPFAIMVQAPGAFICLGLILATMNVINVWQARRKGGQVVETSSCGGCKACSMLQQRQEQ